MTGASLVARWPREHVVDVALAAGVAAATAFILATDLAGSGRAPWPAYLFPLTLGGLALVRRRWPVGSAAGAVGALAVYYGLELPPVGLAIPLAAALYSLADAGRRRDAVWFVVGALVVSSTIRLAEGGERVGWVLGSELVTSLTIMAAAVALGDAAHARRGWAAEVDRRLAEATADQERDARRRVESERLRIARELHDVLAHTVSVIAIQADVASEALTAATAAPITSPGTGRGDDAEAAGAAVRAIRQASRDALGELRSTLRLLRGSAPAPGLQPVAGLADLDRLVAAATDGGLEVAVERKGLAEGPPLPVVVDTAAHRIVQEAITNVLRHAAASRVTILVRATDGDLLVRVEDDGVGVPSPAVPTAGAVDIVSGGYGLRGMAERVGLLGGRMRAGARPGTAGFYVEAWLPVEQRPVASGATAGVAS
jgi:signal transduction histidine kinase